MAISRVRPSPPPPSFSSRQSFFHPRGSILSINYSHDGEEKKKVNYVFNRASTGGKKRKRKKMTDSFFRFLLSVQSSSRRLLTFELYSDVNDLPSVRRIRTSRITRPRQRSSLFRIISPDGKYELRVSCFFPLSKMFIFSSLFRREAHLRSKVFAQFLTRVQLTSCVIKSNNNNSVLYYCIIYETISSLMEYYFKITVFF